MMAEKIMIKTEHIKLDAFLKLCGAAGTGGRAKELVLSGAVSVDGKICTERGRKLKPGAAVTLENKNYEVCSG